MEIKIAFNYPEKLIKIIKDFFKGQADSLAREGRKDKLKEKFLKDHPLINKIYKVIIFGLIFSGVLLLIVYLSPTLPLVNIEIPPKIIGIIEEIVLWAFVALIFSFLFLEVVAALLDGEKIFGWGIKRKIKG